MGTSLEATAAASIILMKQTGKMVINGCRSLKDTKASDVAISPVGCFRREKVRIFADFEYICQYMAARWSNRQAPTL
jgi:TATA-box binding protein (TBP) (component of TFIID and TFIIIB)